MNKRMASEIPSNSAREDMPRIALSGQMSVRGTAIILLLLVILFTLYPKTIPG